jgi:hypothetical protein
MGSVVGSLTSPIIGVGVGGGGGAAPIDPTTIASLYSLVDGNNTGGTYQFWNDQHTGDKDVRRSPDSSGTFSGGSAVFNGDESWYYNNSQAGFTAGEIFVRLKKDVALSDEAWGHLGSTSVASLYSRAGTGLIYDAFGTSTRKSCGAIAIDAAQWHTLNIYSAPNDWAMRIAGEVQYSTLTNTVSFSTQPRIGCSYAASNPLNGQIKAMALFNAKLSDEDRAGVQAWFDAL